MLSLLSASACGLKLTCHADATWRFRVRSTPVNMPKSTNLRFVLYLRLPYGAQPCERNSHCSAPPKIAEVDDEPPVFKSVFAPLFRPALAHNLLQSPSPHTTPLFRTVETPPFRLALAQNLPQSPSPHAAPCLSRTVSLKSGALAHNPFAKKKRSPPRTLAPKSSRRRPRDSRPNPAALAQVPLWGCVAHIEPGGGGSKGWQSKDVVPTLPSA